MKMLNTIALFTIGTLIFLASMGCSSRHKSTIQVSAYRQLVGRLDQLKPGMTREEVLHILQGDGRIEDDMEMPALLGGCALWRYTIEERERKFALVIEEVTASTNHAMVVMIRRFDDKHWVCKEPDTGKMYLYLWETQSDSPTNALMFSGE